MLLTPTNTVRKSPAHCQARVSSTSERISPGATPQKPVRSASLIAPANVRTGL